MKDPPYPGSIQGVQLILTNSAVRMYNDRQQKILIKRDANEFTNA
jgi:hypothetical protein